MKKDIDKLNDAIFIVTSEESCPYYDFGDELKVENSSLKISGFKPVCLYLSKNIEQIVTLKEGSGRLSRLGGLKMPGHQKSKYDCGGCTGLIQFEFKREKGYITLQMQLLKEAEEQRNRKRLDKFYNVLRMLDIFEPLEDESLRDLILLLDFKTVLPDKVLLKKGDPSAHLYIILKGQVAVIDDNHQKISEINSGEIFGEMSLLSGEPENNSLHTMNGTQVAMLSVKNFRHILKKFPTLQIFLFKLLIDRVQAQALLSGNISSGMTGDLEEVPAIDLMQLINSSQKTGSIEVVCSEGSATVYFDEGEIIYAKFKKLSAKDAVFALLTIRKGFFTYSRGIPDELKMLPPIGGFIGLMMEGVQGIDEQNHEEE
ncbi:MAG: DUF4388 domain-containing protein [Desulfobulbaceae bacterium]|nr:DUF4388 domain-containing protein [Desulfobulbaceae bacterium]